MEKPIPQRLTKTALKERGWTESSIRRFLSESDEQRVNPTYRNASPMLLWNLDKVEAIEASEEWQAWKAKSSRRSEAALQVAEMKRQQLLEEIAKLPLKINLMPREKLIRAACNHYNRRQQEKQEHFEFDSNPPASPDSDRVFLDRITVNYLRHKCSYYENSFEENFGKVGVNEAYALISKRVFQAIAEAYPWLHEECERQRAAKFP